MASTFPIMISWLEKQRQRSEMTSRPIAFADSQEWTIQDGMLVHATGGFFRVEGLKGRFRALELSELQQPIINQPEIGILGFLVCRRDGGVRWLLQSKNEPGNVGAAQLAPSVQATFSNYMRKHGGAPTFYLDHFLGAEGYLSDSLQSEQGTRFLTKFNRNAVVEVPEEAALASNNFGWCSTSDLKDILLTDYAINTDARSVIATAPWSLLSEGAELFSGERAEACFGNRLAASYRHAGRENLPDLMGGLLAAIRADIAIDIEACGLDELDGWIIGNDKICSQMDDRELVVEHYEVSAPDRERTHWDQPLFRSLDIDKVQLFCQQRDSLLRFLLRPAIEAGLTEGVEIGATYKKETAALAPDWLRELVHSARGTARLSVEQSDEGGRFMESRCRYGIVELPADVHVPDDQWNIWVTLSELEALCRTPKLLTNEARSVVSVLLGLA